MNAFDYIIIGAGSAGCILADRLSASGKHSVLLIEAGEMDASPWFSLPAGFAKMYYNPRYNYMYYSEPEAELNQRKIYAPRGKVVGGSGSINAMIYVRGSRQDYADWASVSNAQWDYEAVLPYFKKLENHPLGDSEYHSSQGKIGITQMADDAHPLCQYYLDSCQQLGYPYNPDFNGEHFVGAGIYDANIAHGKRASSAKTYLVDALKRRNLTLMTETQVEKIDFDTNHVATSVRIRTHGGQSQTLTAQQEIILSAGAVDSPKLLQLSGVGAKSLLESFNIPVVLDLPAVGENLQDHLCVSYYYEANIKTLNDDLGTLWGQAKAALTYLFKRRGPLALSVNQAGGFFKTASDLAEPNIQLYFNPLSYVIPKDPKAALKPDPYSGFLLAFNPTRPTSRGKIELASADYQVPAKIIGNYLSTAKDRQEVIDGQKLIRQIMASPALQSITVREVSPKERVSDEASMLDFFKSDSGSIYHLCGSCAMGNDPQTSVVDADLRVHGLKQLRVVDASIFPNITSGNINAPVMMVAEKAADLILQAHRSTD